MGSHGAGRLL